MSLKDRLNELEDEVKYSKMKEDTKLKKKEWKYPFKWKSSMNKSTKKNPKDIILVMYLNARGILEQPMLLPLYSGNLIIYKDKVHEFDPRALNIMRDGGKMYKVLLIREIDRKPFCNLDWDLIKDRGDTTRNDEVLLKMLRLAMIEKVKKAAANWMWYILGALVAGGIVYYLFMAK